MLKGRCPKICRAARGVNRAVIVRVIAIKITRGVHRTVTVHLVDVENTRGVDGTFTVRGVVVIEILKGDIFIFVFHDVWLQRLLLSRYNHVRHERYGRKEVRTVENDFRVIELSRCAVRFNSTYNRLKLLRTIHFSYEFIHQ